MMTATQQRAVGGIGLAIDAGLLWNARRLYKKGKGGWGTFFLVWGVSGAAWNVYQLATASEKPMVARYAQVPGLGGPVLLRW